MRERKKNPQLVQNPPPPPLSRVLSASIGREVKGSQGTHPRSLGSFSPVQQSRVFAQHFLSEGWSNFTLRDGILPPSPSLGIDWFVWLGVPQSWETLKRQGEFYRQTTSGSIAGRLRRKWASLGRWCIFCWQDLPKKEHPLCYVAGSVVSWIRWYILL